MNQHPAVTMVSVWGLCILTFLVLPFQLLERQFALEGFIVFCIFFAAFLLGGALVPTPIQKKIVSSSDVVDEKIAARVLMVVAVVANLAFLLDIQEKNVFDLAASYDLRSETADALLKGDASNSSYWFQIGFLLYPASYVFIAIHLLYAERINGFKLLIFGLLPVLMATVSMGGRLPIFYAVLVIGLSWRDRNKVNRKKCFITQESGRNKYLFKLLWLFFLVALFLYFVAIFVTRAAVAGGALEMFAVAEERWGVGFNGLFADLIFSIFGEDYTYLVFIFSWYLIQGVVMSNYLFSAYDGPMQMGVYGIDLVSAVMRRLKPELVAQGFDTLLTLGTYGFFPSAWGSLYVDFGYFSIIICMVWGAASVFSYKRIVIQKNQNWLIVGPFVTIGLVFSIINTPLGFTNGLVTHIWLFITFVMLRKIRKCSR